MRASHFLILLVVAAICATSGCTTATSLRISGTPGEQFTARYRTPQGLSGDITTTVAHDGRSATALKVTGEELNFDVKKKHGDAQINAEVVQRGKTVFRAEVPPGTRGVRISRTSAGWQQESY